MSERQIKEYYERIEKLLNGANKETYGFAPQEIKNILRSYEELQNQNQELNKQLEELKEEKQEWIYLLGMFKNQQKKFIEYLGNYDKCFCGEEILLKYKEIVGNKYE